MPELNDIVEHSVDVRELLGGAGKRHNGTGYQNYTLLYKSGIKIKSMAKILRNPRKGRHGICSILVNVPKMCFFLIKPTNNY